MRFIFIFISLVLAGCAQKTLTDPARYYEASFYQAAMSR